MTHRGGGVGPSAGLFLEKNEGGGKKGIPERKEKRQRRIQM
jgi:hypothetical protein